MALAVHRLRYVSVVRFQRRSTFVAATRYVSRTECRRLVSLHAVTRLLEQPPAAAAAAAAATESPASKLSPTPQQRKATEQLAWSRLVYSRVPADGRLTAAAITEQCKSTDEYVAAMSRMRESGLILDLLTAFKALSATTLRPDFRVFLLVLNAYHLTGNNDDAVLLIRDLFEKHSLFHFAGATRLTTTAVPIADRPAADIAMFRRLMEECRRHDNARGAVFVYEQHRRAMEVNAACALRARDFRIMSSILVEHPEFNWHRILIPRSMTDVVQPIAIFLDEAMNALTVSDELCRDVWKNRLFPLIRRVGLDAETASTLIRNLCELKWSDELKQILLLIPALTAPQPQPQPQSHEKSASNTAETIAASPPPPPLTSYAALHPSAVVILIRYFHAAGLSHAHVFSMLESAAASSLPVCNELLWAEAQQTIPSLERTQSIMRVMQSNRLQPDARTYNFLITILSRLAAPNPTSADSGVVQRPELIATAFQFLARMKRKNHSGTGLMYRALILALDRLTYESSDSAAGYFLAGSGRPVLNFDYHRRRAPYFTAEQLQLLTDSYVADGLPAFRTDERRYAAIIKLFYHTGDYSSLLLFYRSALAATNELSGLFEPSDSRYGKVVRGRMLCHALAAAGQPKLARRYLDALKPTAGAQSVHEMYHWIIASYVIQNREPQTVLELIREYTEWFAPQFKPSAAAAVASASATGSAAAQSELRFLETLHENLIMSAAQTTETAHALAPEQFAKLQAAMSGVSEWSTERPNTEAAAGADAVNPYRRGLRHAIAAAANTANDLSRLKSIWKNARDTAIHRSEEYKRFLAPETETKTESAAAASAADTAAPALTDGTAPTGTSTVRATAKPNPSAPVFVRVTRLPLTYDPKKLRALFSVFGVVDYVRCVPSSAAGDSGQFHVGFVRFQFANQARRAVAALNLQRPIGCHLPLRVTIVLPDSVAPRLTLDTAAASTTAISTAAEQQQHVQL